MAKSTSLKIALAHDSLREYGGAERVLEALHELYPEAPVYVAFKDEQAMGIHWQKFANWDIRESWLAQVPFIKQIYSPLRIFSAHAFAHFDFSKYDVVLSSSNAYMAKAVQIPRGVHVCYCHTPPRSLYGYTTMSNWKAHPLTHFFGVLINHYMRVIDVKVAQEVDYFIANSKETQRRIKTFYRRDSTVIYPPVEVGMANSQTLKKSKEPGYYLYVGRLAQSKHVELAIQACTQLHRPLKLVGEGKGLEYLKSIAGPEVEFLGGINDGELTEVYDGARALLFPAEDEDFGIVPIEAMAHGVPVIAHRSGGPRETIIENKTGVFFDELTVDSLSDVIENFEKKIFVPATLIKHAESFNKERFQKEIQAFVTKVTSK